MGHIDLWTDRPIQTVHGPYHKEVRGVQRTFGPRCLLTQSRSDSGRTCEGKVRALLINGLNTPPAAIVRLMISGRRQYKTVESRSRGARACGVDKPCRECAREWLAEVCQRSVGFRGMYMHRQPLLLLHC